jgi:hypothetical protein
MQHCLRADEAYGWVVFSIPVGKADWRWGLTILTDGRWFLGVFRRVR